MPATRHTRVTVALVSSTAAAVIGWFSVQDEPPAQTSVAAVIAAKAPQVTTSAARPAATEPPGAVLARLERDLALTLDPDAAGPCTGERLLELLRRIRSTESQPAFAYARRWAQQAPQEMFDWCQSHGGVAQPMGDGRGMTTFRDTLFLAWGQRDPEKALAAALQVQGKFERPGALAAVIEGVRKTDPARALAMASENLAVLAGSRIGHLSAYGPDYRKTWDFLRSLPPGSDRGVVLANFYDDICRYHTEDSAQLWKETPEEVRREMATSNYNRMYAPGTMEGLADFQRTHVEATGDRTLAWHYLQNGAREWAARDPAAAIAWAQEHLKGEQRVTGTTQMFSAGAEKNFDATLQAWQALPDGILRARAAGNLAAGAPVERKAEVDALLGSLSPADRGLAETALKAAGAARRQREAMEQMQKSLPGPQG